jgi:hypothetical protein
MASDDLSQDTIPDRLLRAKQTAVTQLLPAAIPGPAASLAPFAVSVRPQDNVVGIGIGYKLTDGSPTAARAVRIYVARKVAPGAIPTEFMLPEAIEGIPTDVVEAGRFRPLPAVVPVAQQHLRPARPGCSVGFQFTGAEARFVMAGTLGAVVTAEGKRYILSNNHVLANENRLPIDSPIFQPGLMDGGEPARHQIATLTRFVPITAAGPNAVDGAIAEILTPSAVRPTFLPRVGRLASAATVAATEDMQVHKVGRTTGYTKGTVFDISADVAIPYELGDVTFQDQILIRGERGMFSDRGDSGSVIVERGTKQAVGLLFAGSPLYTIANPIATVLAQLGVSLVR